MQSLLIVLATSLVAASAHSQVIPEWERLHTVPIPQVRGEALAPVGSTGDWYVGGHTYSLVIQDYFSPWLASGHVLMRLDEQGQLVWIQAWPPQSAPLQSAGALELAEDPTGDVRLIYLSSASGAVIERRSAVDGSIVWSTPGPIASGLIRGSLTVVDQGRQIAAFYRGGDIERLVHGADGSLLQSTVFSTGITPQQPGYVGTVDAVSGRLAVAATVWSSNGTLVVFAQDGSIAWSNSTIDMTISSLAFGPGGVLAAVGTDSLSHARFQLFAADGTLLGGNAIPPVGPFGQGWFSVAIDAWGNAIAVGQRGDEARIAKFSPAGALEWDQSWAGGAGYSDYFSCVLVTASGEYVTAGSTTADAIPFFPSTQAYFTAWRPDGTLAWEHIDPPSMYMHEIPYAIAESALGSIVSVGDREHLYDTQFGGAYVPDGVHVLSLRPQASAFCFGDAASTSLCPCANASAPGAREGCANSTGVGARIADAGLASLSVDTLDLSVSGLPASTTCLVFQTQSGGAVAFGDGLRCALGGAVIRLYSAQASGGVVTVPPPGGARLSARSTAAGDPLSAGSVRYVQAYYRNVAPFCTPAGFNTSSGLIVTWAP